MATLTAHCVIKNEENFITKTLQPFLDAGIDSYLILDTGSDDNTIFVTEKLFEKWNSLMIRKYGFENPTRAEVLEFASKLTRFYEILLEDDPVPKIEINNINKN